jgi:hypothetical protein
LTTNNQPIELTNLENEYYTKIINLIRINDAHQ